MELRATASFDIAGWDEEAYDDAEGSPRLSRATVRKVFEGDLEGESTAELLMCVADPGDYAAGAGYVASEHVTGTLAGRQGTFVLQHGGLTSKEGERTFGHIVPGSGTGDLTGIHGEAEISRTPDGAHMLRLDYAFEDAEVA